MSGYQSDRKEQSMKRFYRWTIPTLVIACLQLSACRQSAEEQEEEGGSAIIEHLEGTQPTRVTLTEEAAKRIDIQTAPVTDASTNGQSGKAIPYSAVLYDTQGDTWTYTSPQPLTYIRHPVTVEHIDGELAILSDGPPVGTAVVTVGAAELYGSEIEFEEE
jgi:hypothetical protein